MRLVTLLTLTIVLFISGNALAVITVDVMPSSAPNGYGAPSWNGYAANALSSLENNLGNVGDRAIDPTAYEIAGPIVEPGDFMVTSFNSWRGEVNPTGAFANEYGNRMHFGLHAYGDGSTQFALNDLTFQLHSSDPGDALVFIGDFIGYNYNGTTRFGVDWGGDRAKGGGDDVIYASGNGTTLVDEIVYVGVGNALWPGGGDPTPASPIGGAQAAIDDTVAYINAGGPFAISCTYEINGYTGFASVSTIPEPSTLIIWSLLGAVGITVGWYRRRKV